MLLSFHCFDSLWILQFILLLFELPIFIVYIFEHFSLYFWWSLAWIDVYILDLWEWLFDFSAVCIQACTTSHWKRIDWRLSVCAKENVWDSRLRFDESFYGERTTICGQWFLCMFLLLNLFVYNWLLFDWILILNSFARLWMKDVTCLLARTIRHQWSSFSTRWIWRLLRNRVTCAWIILGLKWKPLIWYVSFVCSSNFVCFFVFSIR
jgi:hypothetical protein